MINRIGWWDEFNAGFTWQGRERTLLNGVIDQTENEIGAVERRMAAMAREIVQLRTIVTVLVATLRDANVVDGHILDVRMQAAFEASEPQPATGAPGSTSCVACKAHVLLANTVMTVDGPLCDACASR